ncbi:hypothetical protein Tco_1415136 [Tanacetum coccineum]
MSLSRVGSLNDNTVEPRYDSDILSEVPHYDTYHDSDMLNSNIQELGYIENIVSNNESYDELTSNINVISYTDYMLTIGNNEDNYVPPLVQTNDMMLTVKQMKSQVEKCNMVNQESKSVNELLINELERYKEKVRILENAPKNSSSEKEALLDRELRTVICDGNRKVSDHENQVFSQRKQMEDLTNQVNFRRKGRGVISEDKDDKGVKLKFRRGKVIDIQSGNNGPRRLKFRKRTIEGNEDGQSMARRTYKNKT